ncbi:MAG: sensor histidine kinase [Crocinitomicaceae bacterium]
MYDKIRSNSKYRVSKNLYFISIICFAIISCTTYSDNVVYFTQALSGLILSVFSLILLVKTKNYKLPVYISISISIFVVLLSFLTSSFANNQGDLFWIIVLSLFAFYMLGKIWAIMYLSVNIGSMIIVKLLNLHDIIELPFESVAPHFLSEVNYVINLIACSVLFIYLVGQILSEYEESQAKLLVRNNALKTKDAEKTTMLKEIHHRVKNNLQVIISLLRLQLFQLNNDDSISGPFQDSINRITTMALIHEKMYKGDNINSLNVEDYIKDLANDILTTYVNSKKIDLKIKSDINQLTTDDLVPFSLIINELITNSIKHGFKNAETGIIEINLINTTIGFDFVYKDSGIWLENDSSQSFGLELIETLNGHFDGIYHKNISDAGTEFIFNFKLP